MKYSLLHKIEDAPAACEVLYDLSVDRAINRIVPDKRVAEAFLAVLAEPLTVRENILYRQKIYEDFKKIPGLFDALRLLLSRYDRIKSDWQEMKLSAAPAQRSGAGAEALLDYTFASLKITAIFPSTVASFFSSIGKTLRGYSIASEGLRNIRDKCEEMARSEALNELVEISGLFRSGSPEDFDFNAAVRLDETLKLAGADVTEILEKRKTGGSFDRLLSGIGGRKNAHGKKEGEELRAELSETGEDPWSNTLLFLNEALARIDTTLTRVTDELYEAFFGLSGEMLFYAAALAVEKEAERQGVPTVMPEILPEEEDRAEAEGLRELLLLSEGKGRETVPNGISLSEKAGVLVKGLTDSGKTVFLRAVGGAQLMAQAGLPVFAEKAKFSIRRGFFSHFSSAEEEFLSGSAAGRFDQEAREISRILDALRPYSLLLLNETFQTTSYQEGTESIYHILRLLPRMKTKFLFVTHLTRLFDLMRGENVTLAHTSEDPAMKYRIIEE